MFSFVSTTTTVSRISNYLFQFFFIENSYKSSTLVYPTESYTALFWQLVQADNSVIDDVANWRLRYAYGHIIEEPPPPSPSAWSRRVAAGLKVSSTTKIRETGIYKLETGSLIAISIRLHLYWNNLSSQRFCSIESSCCPCCQRRFISPSRSSRFVLRLLSNSYRSIFCKLFRNQVALLGRDLVLLITCHGGSRPAPVYFLYTRVCCMYIKIIKKNLRIFDTHNDRIITLHR